MNIQKAIKAYEDRLHHIRHSHIDQFDSEYNRFHKQEAEKAKEVFDAESVKIQKMIDEAQSKRCSARTITVEDICKALIGIENHLCISKKSMVGIKVSIDINAQNFPSAYKWNPESTLFDAEYKKSGWSLTSVYRWSTQREGHSVKVEHTKDSLQAVTERYKEW